MDIYEEKEKGLRLFKIRNPHGELPLPTRPAPPRPALHCRGAAPFSGSSPRYGSVAGRGMSVIAPAPNTRWHVAGRAAMQVRA